MARPPGDQRAGSWLEKGFARQKSGDIAGAEKAYRQAVAADPGFAAGWANLGVAQRRLGRPEDAVHSYRRALEASGSGAPSQALAAIHANLGNALRELYRHDEAAVALRRAVELAPAHASAWRNLAVTLDEAGDISAALPAYARAVALAPADPDTVWLGCLARLSTGDFSAETWAAFEARWALPGMAPPAALAASPRWRGEAIAGRTLLVSGEQGFGDTLLALRFLAPLAARAAAGQGRIVFSCQPSLVRLVQPSVEALGIAVHRADGPAPPHDLAAPIMSLLGTALRRVDDIPPPLPLAAGTAPPPEAAAAALGGAGDALRVGVVWSGNVAYAGNARRAVSLSRFLPLAGIEGVRLFSLQMGPPRAELEAARRAGETRIVDLADGIRDFADTAAVLRDLDLLVTTDTSVAHLAGALGVPVWNLVHAGCYALYFRERADCPWYPSMRLFRQPRPGDWGSVFAAAAAALAALARAPRDRRFPR